MLYLELEAVTAEQLQREAAALALQRQLAAIEAAQARPLTGDSSDVGQRRMFGDDDLLSRVNPTKETT
jgi:hypothetical protein